jgi:NitT/TauT family transport system substrate-binding protein
MQFFRRHFALLLALTLLTACKSKPAAAPNGLFPIVFQTDWYPQPEHGGFYQADLQGLYKAAGLDVKILPGGPFVIGDQQVAMGAAQFSMGSSDQVLVRVSQGLPLVAVAATMQQDPQAIMLHEESPVRTFEQLDGHAIAVKPGSIWFQYLVNRYNLTHVREIPATYSIANFLQDPGYIQQAFVTSEPFTAQQHGAKVRTMLISSTGYQPYRVFFTSKQFLTEHPDIVAKFVKASLEGWKNYLADPTLVDAELAKLNPNMSPEQMKFSIDTLRQQHFIDGEGTPQSHLGQMTAERWNSTYKQLVDLKVTTGPIDPAAAYTLQFTDSKP